MRIKCPEIDRTSHSQTDLLKAWAVFTLRNQTQNEIRPGEIKCASSRRCVCPRGTSDVSPALLRCLQPSRMTVFAPTCIPNATARTHRQTTKREKAGCVNTVHKVHVVHAFGEQRPLCSGRKESRRWPEPLAHTQANAALWTTCGGILAAVPKHTPTVPPGRSDTRLPLPGTRLPPCASSGSEASDSAGDRCWMQAQGLSARGRPRKAASRRDGQHAKARHLAAIEYAD